MKTYLVVRTATVALAIAACLLLPQTAQSFYNPSTGRWLSRDPVNEKGGHNLFALAQNCQVNRIDYLGEAWWNWTVIDLGQRKPTPDRGGHLTGLTSPIKWSVQTSLKTCPCGYNVQVQGDAVVEYWYSDIWTKIHEEQHVNIFDRAWSETSWAVFPYTIQCVSSRKAHCYQNLIIAIRNYYVAREEVENESYDIAQYGGGPNPPNLIEAIIDEMLWAAEMGRIEDQCNAIP
jgi:hypothetical protein